MHGDSTSCSISLSNIICEHSGANSRGISQELFVATKRSSGDHDSNKDARNKV